MPPPIMGILAAAVVVVVVIAVVVMKKRKRKNFAGADTYRKLLGVDSPATRPAPLSDPKLEALRQNLRVKFLYQEDKIDAAIALERDRNPAASLEQSMKSAIERWERDNR